MLGPPESHEQFQDRVRAQLSARYSAQDLQTWADELDLVWRANLDFADELLRSTYSPDIGRPVEHSPKDLLRCLLLCQQRAKRSLTRWHKQLQREPVLLILSGLAALPCIGTFYTFLDRLHPRLPSQRVYGVVRRHRRVPKPASGQKLPANRQKLARLATWLQNHLDTPAPTPADLWDRVLAATVVGSVDQGIIPAKAPIAVAADGSLLDSGAYSHGHKVCSCPGHGCTCPRYFGDPTARVGYDSTKNRFMLGRTVYTLSETVSGHHLPITLLTGPANQHDAISQMLSLRTARHLLATRLSIATTYADSAHDHDPVYRYCHHLGIEPVTDRHGPTPVPLPAVRDRVSAFDLTLSPDGRPRCAHGFLHSRGHCRTGVRQFQCPNAQPALCPETCCPLHDGSRFTIDVGLQPRLLARNPRTEPYTRKDYRRRTAVERTFSLLTSASGLDTARHRRDYVWHGRLVITALLRHLQLWASTTLPSFASPPTPAPPGG